MFYPIKIDKMRNLRYGMRALSLIEKHFKCPVAKVDYDNLTMEDMAVIMWAGLQHEDEELTATKVMDLIDDHSDIGKVIIEVMKALNNTFGSNEQIENLQDDENEKNA